jgi:hypothetical protein
VLRRRIAMQISGETWSPSSLHQRGDKRSSIPSSSPDLLRHQPSRARRQRTTLRRGGGNQGIGAGLLVSAAFAAAPACHPGAVRSGESSRSGAQEGAASADRRAGRGRSDSRSCESREGISKAAPRAFSSLPQLAKPVASELDGSPEDEEARSSGSTKCPVGRSTWVSQDCAERDGTFEVGWF